MSLPKLRIIHKDVIDDLQVEIRDNGEYRSLYFGPDSLQSRMSLSTPEKLILPYTQYMAAVLLLVPQPANILVIGVGAGSFIRFFTRHLPTCHIDAVDISKQVVELAQRFFQLPEEPCITLHYQDGQQFLSEHRTSRYDLILVDAFDDVGMAASVYSPEFFQQCRNHLADNGTVCCNLWSSDKGRYQEIRKYLSYSFATTLYLPVPERGNIVTYSMQRPAPWSILHPRNKNLKRLAKRYDLDLTAIVRTIRANNLTLSQKIRDFLHLD